MKYFIICLFIFCSCSGPSNNEPPKTEYISSQSTNASPTPPPLKIINQYFALTGLINNSDKALSIIYFDQNSSNGYFLSRDECNSETNKIDFTYTLSNNIAEITLYKNEDYHYPNKIEFTDDNLKVLSINSFSHTTEEYSYYSPCSMRGPNPNFYELDLINTIQTGTIIPSTTQTKYNELLYVDIKSLAISNSVKDQQNKFLEEYNKNHTCSDQKSFDEGYNLARQQYGVTLDIELPEYLFKISRNLGYDYNSYCFKKGVEEYIKDKTN
jgi:hypothetical protein